MHLIWKIWIYCRSELWCKSGAYGNRNKDQESPLYAEKSCSMPYTEQFRLPKMIISGETADAGFLLAFLCTFIIYWGLGIRLEACKTKKFEARTTPVSLRSPQWLHRWGLRNYPQDFERHLWHLNGLRHPFKSPQDSGKKWFTISFIFKQVF